MAQTPQGDPDHERTPYGGATGPDGSGETAGTGGNGSGNGRTGTVGEGRYQLQRRLGRGGMAEVYAAEDLRLGRIVAVKMLRADLAEDAVARARFTREAQAVAGLNHHAVVAVYDTGEDIVDGESVPFIVMECVEGRTIRELLQTAEAPPVEQALLVVSGVLDALGYSHRHGIVHRDIKPANVIITNTGAVKVMDFGIARALHGASTTMTQTGMVMGTPQYLSPEQALGRAVDARSDLYATGCLLYELLTGRPPFTGETPLSVVYQHVQDDPVPPSEVTDRVPPLLDALTLRALAKEPDDRFQSAEEMRGELQRTLRALRAGAWTAEDAGFAAGGAAAVAAAGYAGNTPPDGTPVDGTTPMPDDPGATAIAPAGAVGAYGTDQYGAAAQYPGEQYPDGQYGAQDGGATYGTAAYGAGGAYADGGAYGSGAGGPGGPGGPLIPQRPGDDDDGVPGGGSGGRSPWLWVALLVGAIVAVMVGVLLATNSGGEGEGTDPNGTQSPSPSVSQSESSTPSPSQDDEEETPSQDPPSGNTDDNWNNNPPPDNGGWTPPQDTYSPEPSPDPSDSTPSAEPPTDPATTPGDDSEGGTTEGDTTEGGTTEGDTTEGGTTEGETADGGTSDGGTSDGGADEGATTDGGTNEGSGVIAGMSDGGTSEGSSSSEGNTTP
ncbi:protein kinase domain-containing protein [Allostreptomyces psammosilenae]|uniref:non-specific serine/threonine protein kinase n=1 Tax=Allostreptomyces psammosilenae TaxID=1892865 RepID=A0A852ZX62_9ACTN|nr:tRNA A-37 threonylcarbamoyl transferase component Bud32 [Allostreptomyces psammosilenae]